MSNRKRICVITAQVEESTQNRFMQGFLKQAYDMNYDVCIFSMFFEVPGFNRQGGWRFKHLQPCEILTF